MFIRLSLCHSFFFFFFFSSSLFSLPCLSCVTIFSANRTSGVAGLYKGIEVKLVQTVSMAALMFVAYEKIADAVFFLLKSDMSTGSAGSQLFFIIWAVYLVLGWWSGFK